MLISYVAVAVGDARDGPFASCSLVRARRDQGHCGRLIPAGLGKGLVRGHVGSGPAAGSPVISRHVTPRSSCCRGRSFGGGTHGACYWVHSRGCRHGRGADHERCPFVSGPGPGSQAGADRRDRWLPDGWRGVCRASISSVGTAQERLPLRGFAHANGGVRRLASGHRAVSSPRSKLAGHGYAPGRGRRTQPRMSHLCGGLGIWVVPARHTSCPERPGAVLQKSSLRRDPGTGFCAR